MSRERQEPRIRSEIDGPVITDWKMVGIGVGVGGFSLLAFGVMLAFLPTREPEPPPVAQVPPVKKTWGVPLAVAEPPAPPVIEAAPPAKAVTSRPAPAPRTTPISRPIVARVAPKPLPVPRQSEEIAPAAVAAPPPRLEFDRSTEKQLADWLRVNVPEIDLDHVKGTSKKLFAKAKATHAAANAAELRPGKKDQTGGLRSAEEKLLLELVKARPDLAGLPLHLGAACQTSRDSAKKMTRYSGQIRLVVLDRAEGEENPSSRAMDYAASTRWRQSEAVPALEQILQAEDEPSRLLLVSTLAETSGPAASQALARRAVFDLSPLVRERAVAALDARPKKEFRSIMFQAFRHPWAPAAAHAAEALVALKDREAAADLKSLLALPDPSAPVRRKDGKMEFPQVVRVNHLRNCLLCHAASFEAREPIRGFIPKQGEAIPLFYYGERSGDFVRADVVYLRQDFSVRHGVQRANPWPEMQRYDYLVRKKELSDDEAKQWTAGNKRASYPQRTAALIALRWLTQENVGQETADDAGKEWAKALKEDGYGSPPSTKSEAKPRP